LFIEREQKGERALLCVIHDRERSQAEADEFESLARASGAEIVGTWDGVVQQPRAHSYVGKGQLEQIAAAVREHEADLLLVNQDLSPAQERNVERELKCRVLGRTGLILDLFAARARTAEGKLQVELAQLRHLATRLVRGWSHLDRQKGGIGLRGAGETQLELDQRLIAARIKRLVRDLAEVQARRGRNRSARRRAGLPVVALVGYTNAGKSTLFNRLTGADVFAADQLFATLDPTLRRVELPGVGTAVLADTVGFVSRLPHRLVQAFRATLEEAADADLLVHVIDGSDPEWPERRAAVEAVLEEIEAQDAPRLDVFNKADLPAPGAEPLPPEALRVSARTGEGVELLARRIAAALEPGLGRFEAHVAPRGGRVRALLYERSQVLGERAADDGGWVLSLRLPPEDARRLAAEPDVTLVALPGAPGAEAAAERIAATPGSA
jgi:GTP-binding protein HflX